jgi:hypothetical protein
MQWKLQTLKFQDNLLQIDTISVTLAVGRPRHLAMEFLRD